MIFRDRINAFNILLKILTKSSQKKSFNSILEKVEKNNPWFVKENVQYAIIAICHMLHPNKLDKWMDNYDLGESSVKKIGVIVPSNIPLVGFYDFICVLLSGNIFIGKLSVKNNVLLPFLADLLIDINADFKHYIHFKHELLDIDLLIATGDDNSADYFNYLFSSIPRIIRKHRNSICVLNGLETKDDYLNLMSDILMYYGLGCRNISKIYVPDNYDLTILQSYLKDHFNEKISKNYLDNYIFQKTKYTLNQVEFIDCNHTLLIESKHINAPIGVIYYEFYNNIDAVKKYLTDHSELIQCVVSNQYVFDRIISFGKSQIPELHDAPDGVDVMHFICFN